MNAGEVKADNSNKMFEQNVSRKIILFKERKNVCNATRTAYQ